MKHFHEKPREEHGIQLSYSWVKQALHGAGLVARKKKRTPHRQRRPRKELPGIMLHIDGSKHAWLQVDRYHDLIVMLDDATSDSPQARGRMERSYGNWQGRLPQELRVAGIRSVDQANQFLRERYIAEFNRKFTVPAAQPGTAFRKCGRRDLDRVFSVQTERVVSQVSCLFQQVVGELHAYAQASSRNSACSDALRKLK